MARLSPAFKKSESQLPGVEMCDAQFRLHLRGSFGSFSTFTASQQPGPSKRFWGVTLSNPL